MFDSGFHKQVPIELLAVTISVSRRMIALRSGSCLSPNFSGIKANSIEAANIIDKYHVCEGYSYALARLDCTRFYLQVFPDLNGIIQ